jgi:putative tryptophan/tyrosine transport system substrate-binding protein
VRAIVVLLLWLASGQPVAQSVSTPPRIGYLSLGAEQSPQAAFRAAFLSGLSDLGYRDGRAPVMHYRFAEGHPERLAGLANELATSSVDILIGEGIQASLALKRASNIIPIVTLSCDAVAAGLVPSLAQPGSNVTGVSCMTPDLAAKRLQLLREIHPTLSRVGILWNASDPAKAAEFAATQEAAAILGIPHGSYQVRQPGDFQTNFAAMRSHGTDGVVVIGDSFTIFHRQLLVELATAHRLPVVYPFREFVEAGGLVGYGPNLPAMFRSMAIHVDKILKGARPAELPIEQPTSFDFLISQPAARAIGLQLPSGVLARAVELIE